MDKFRKVIASISMVAILSTFVVSATAFAAFSDVPANEWFAQYVSDLEGAGLVTGSKFNPGTNLTRADAAMWLVGKAGLTADVPATATFKDVPKGHPAFSAIETAVSHGVVSGYAAPKAGYFGPNDSITREQFAKMATEAFGLEKQSGCGMFTDSSSIASWACDYVATVYHWSVVGGYPNGSFGPGANINRAEGSKMVVLSASPVARAEAPTTPTASGPLTVSAGAEPTAQYLAGSTAYNDVVNVVLKAGAEDVSVTGFTVLKGGLAADTVVSGVSVFTADGVRYGNFVSISDKVADISFDSKPIVVKAGQSSTVTVKVNLASTATAGTLNFKVTAIDSNAKSTSGLPIQGRSFSLQDGSNTIGTLAVDSQSISTSTRTVDVGVTDQDVAKFTFTAGSNEGMNVKMLTLLNNGTAADGDVKDVELVDKNGKVLSTAQLSGKEVVFDFSNSPLFIKEGVTETIRVRLDVVDGSSRTVQFNIQNDYDILASGAETSVSVLPTAGGSQECTFPLGDSSACSSGTETAAADMNKIQINAGALTVSKSTTSPSGKFGQGAQDVVLGTWKLDASGEKMEVRQICFDLQNAGATSGTFDDLTGSIKVVLSGGKSVYSATPVTSHDDGTCDVYTLSSYFTVDPAKDETVSLVVNVKQDITAGDTFTAEFGKVYYKKLTSNTFATAASTEVAANTLTAEAKTLSVSEDTSYPDQTFVKGGSVKLAQFNLQAGAAEKLSLQTVVVDVSSVTGLTNLKLMSNGEQLGSTIATPATTDNSFSVSGNLQIDAGSTASLEVWGNVSSAGSGTYIVSTNTADITFTGVSSGSSGTAPAAAVTFQTLTSAAAGTLAVSSPSQAAASILHAGETGKRLLDFKLEAANEDMTVDTVTVTTENGGGDLQNFTLKRSDGTVVKAGVSVINDLVQFSGLTETITKDTQKSYYVEAGTTDSGALLSGRKVFVALAGIEATGSDSGSNVRASASGNVVASAVSSTKAYSLGDIIFSSGAISDYHVANATVPAGSDMTGVASNLLAANGDAAGATGADAGELLTSGFPTRQVYTAPASGGSNNAWEIGTLLFVIDDNADANTGFGVVTTAVSANTLGNADSLEVALNGDASSTTTVTVATGDNMVEVDTYGGGIIASGVLNVDFAVGDVAYLYDADGTNGFYMADAALTAGATITGAGAVFTGITLANGDVISKLKSTCTEAIGTLASDTADCDYNVGDVLWFEDASSTDGFVVVETAVEKGDVWAAGSIGGGATLAATDRLSKVYSPAAEGKLHTLHDVEPVITNSAKTFSSTITGSEQTVAIWDITASGPRSMYVSSIAVTCTGSYASNTGANDNTFRTYVNGTLENTTAASDCTTGTTITFASPIEIGSNTSKEFEFKYDTAATSGQASGESFVLKLNGTSGDWEATQPLSWYYTAAGASPGNEPTAAAPTTQSDSYPVNGPTLTY
ncbi:hypothetical protein COU74_04935 [Candidatus Peregrinibacteria bacterium CG10_big_fil_rev_8_21_14_0_10_36_19]|nr:MAG: hypothetical protein COU74_04935 [Candidatus Peregrinibacteria bacterium CG10_big_fil_rev_8_21_14_0_10_36_19]